MQNIKVDQQYNNKEEVDKIIKNQQTDNSIDEDEVSSSDSIQQQYLPNQNNIKSIQQKFAYLSNQQSVGYTIIGQSSTNQILQISLLPKQRLFIRGKILYSNIQFKNKYEIMGYNSITAFIKQMIKTSFNPMRKIYNSKQNICYCGISRAGGKIIALSNQAYGNNMYVNARKIILSNFNHQNSLINKHPDFMKFQNRIKVNQKTQKQKTIILLQSSNDNIIVQKYLAQQQQMYIVQKCLIALSGTIKIKRNFAGLSSTKLIGPGWVFLQNDSDSLIRQNKFTIFFVLFIIYYLLITSIDIEF